MKGIKNFDRTILEGILADIDVVMSFLYTGQTTTYSHILENSLTGEFALIIDLDDIAMMQNTYPTQLTSIGDGLVEQVTDLGEGWQVELEDLNGELEDPETAFPNV